MSSVDMHCRPSRNQDADSDSARLGWDQASAFLSRFQVLLLLLREQEPHLKTEVLEGQLNQYVGIWFTFFFFFFDALLFLSEKFSTGSGGEGTFIP